MTGNFKRDSGREIFRPCKRIRPRRAKSVPAETSYAWCFQHREGFHAGRSGLGFSEAALSFEHIQAAYRRNAPGFKEKSVLICLAFHKNPKDGQCNPGLGLIAEECQMSRPLVVRCLKNLKAAGLLFITKNGRTSQYDFTLAEQLQSLARINFRSKHGATSEVKTSSSECGEPKGNQKEEPKGKARWNDEGDFFENLRLMNKGLMEAPP